MRVTPRIRMPVALKTGLNLARDDDELRGPLTTYHDVHVVHQVGSRFTDRGSTHQTSGYLSIHCSLHLSLETHSHRVSIA